MASRLDGKVAVVGGAGSSAPGIGTGKAISVLFAREGASVLLVDLHEDRAAETLQMIEAEGGTASTIGADITDPAACDAVAAAAVDRYGRLDVLVNNAAIAPLQDLVELPPDVYEQVIAVNQTGPYHLSRAAIPRMIDSGGGSIVTVSSVAAVRATGVSQTAYSVSKAALHGLTVDIAGNFGKYRIRANVVMPGTIDTPMASAAARAAGVDATKVDLTNRTALGIIGDAWDIAYASLYLASDEARFVTGVVLPVDGGSSIRMPS